MTIEQELQGIDFSHMSKIKESLRMRLHEELSGRKELSLDELDQVAAAGNPHAGTFGQRNRPKS